MWRKTWNKPGKCLIDGHKVQPFLIHSHRHYWQIPPCRDLIKSSFNITVCGVFSCRLAAFAAQRVEGKMPSPSFTLDAQLRFHDKWLKIDLQVCTRGGVCNNCLSGQFSEIQYSKIISVMQTVYSQASKHLQQRLLRLVVTTVKNISFTHLFFRAWALNGGIALLVFIYYY